MKELNHAENFTRAGSKSFVLPILDLVGFHFSTKSREDADLYEILASILCM